MKLQNAAWVLVADAGRFLVLENHGDEDLIDLRVLAAETHERAPTSEQGADRPGRLAAVGARRVAAVETDWHALDEGEGAKDLAERLNGWAGAKAFPALLLIADPKTLGAMRPHLDEATKRKVLAEFNKDLTHMPVDALEKWISEV